MMDTAQEIVRAVARGDVAAVEQRLAAAIKPYLSAEMLRATWQGLEQQYGAFEDVEKTAEVALPQAVVQVVTCRFARGSLDVNVAFNAAGEINSLTVTPVDTVEQQVNASYAPPPYAQPERFREEEVQVGEEPWVLPGTLSLPQGAGPFAGVVLVHGSGPADRDETIPPNKPFRDLAWGLASRGIAVLRYEKRTKAYGAQMRRTLEAVTVKEETLDDALAAVALLRGRPEIDGRHVFVLGHSLGGFVAPRLGAADAQLAGLVVLAGSARRFEDVILDQMTYVLSLNVPEAVAAPQLATLKQQVALVKDAARLPTAAASDLPLNLPAAYWVDLNAYQPEQVARTLAMPMLFLLGESDYQVTLADWHIWQAALGGRDDVQFRLYPGLSHLFTPVEGGHKATPATYTVAGHVAEEVVNEVARWIQEHAGQAPH